MPTSHFLEVFHGPGTFEDTSQSVIVGGFNRIKLMIMTPGTPQRQAEYGTTESVDLLVDDVHLHFGLIDFRQNLGPQCQETGCGQQAGPYFIILGWHQVTR